jgi:hypothetical protein
VELAGQISVDRAPIRGKRVTISSSLDPFVSVSCGVKMESTYKKGRFGQSSPVAYHYAQGSLHSREREARGYGGVLSNYLSRKKLAFMARQSNPCEQ